MQPFSRGCTRAGTRWCGSWFDLDQPLLRRRRGGRAELRRARRRTGLAEWRVFAWWWRRSVIQAVDATASRRQRNANVTGVRSWPCSMIDQFNSPTIPTPNAHTQITHETSEASPSRLPRWPPPTRRRVGAPWRTPRAPLLGLGAGPRPRRRPRPSLPRSPRSGVCVRRHGRRGPQPGEDAQGRPHGPQGRQGAGGAAWGARARGARRRTRRCRRRREAPASPHRSRRRPARVRGARPDRALGRRARPAAQWPPGGRGPRGRVIGRPPRSPRARLALAPNLRDLRARAPPKKHQIVAVGNDDKACKQLESDLGVHTM
jgi:hypothetical protein